MQFGLWFEPEMVNPDSNLYREHPDWILAAEGRVPLQHRNQLVLDLTNPEVWTYLRDRMDAILGEVPHRLREVGPQPRPARGRQRPVTAGPRRRTRRDRPTTPCSTTSALAIRTCTGSRALPAAGGSTWA